MQNNTPKKTKYLCWKQKPFLLRLRSTGRLFPLSFSHSSQMLYIARIQMLHITFDNLLSPYLLWKTSASLLNENFMHSKHNPCISHALKTDQNVCWHCSTQSDSHFIEDSHDFLEARYISTKIFCDFVDLDPYGKERQDEEEGICQLILLVYFPINVENRPCKLSSGCFRFFWWARVALGKPVCGR